MLILRYSFDEIGSMMEVPNIFYLTYHILKQVEKNKVITYGDIAQLLGDKIASRAVGRLMAINKYPDDIPCYKVIHSDGSVGKYSGPGGTKEKIRRLKKDGIDVSSSGKINLLKHRQNLSKIRVIPYLKSLKSIQTALANLVDTSKHVDPNDVNLIVSTDVSYIESYPDFGIGTAVLIECKTNCKVLEFITVIQSIYFPYIPTYLAFRELPVLLSAINELIKETKIKPDIFLFDGHGVLHPRGFGLASHAGILLDMPSIGVAKSRLVGKESKDVNEVGDKAYVKVTVNEKYYGYKIFPKGNPKKAIYVSPGNLINHESALKFIISKGWVKDRYYPMLVPHKIVSGFRRILIDMLKVKK